MRPGTVDRRYARHVTQARSPNGGPRHPAVVDFVHCVRAWGGLAARGQLRSPNEYVGTYLQFRDGTTSLVFRETVRRAPTLEPALLVIQFSAGRAREQPLGARCLSPRMRPAHAVIRRLPRVSLEALGRRRRHRYIPRRLRVGWRGGLVCLRGPDGGSAGSLSNAGTARFHVPGGVRRETFLRDPQAVPADGADGWWQLEQPVQPRRAP